MVIAKNMLRQKALYPSQKSPQFFRLGVAYSQDPAIAKSFVVLAQATPN